MQEFSLILILNTLAPPQVGQNLKNYRGKLTSFCIVNIFESESGFLTELGGLTLLIFTRPDPQKWTKL